MSSTQNPPSPDPPNPRGPDTVATHVHPRQVWQLAWPIIVGLLSYTFMALADTIYVAILGGDDPSYVAAIGLAGVTLFTFHAFATGVLSGVKISVAQSTGAGDHAKGLRLAWQGVWLAIVLGSLEATLGLVSEPILSLLGADEAVTSKAVTYFDVRALSAPFACGWFAFQAYFQGSGDTLTPMKAAIAANAFNIALDPILIFGVEALGIPAMGISGAAWATVASMVLGCFMMAMAARPHLTGTSARLDRKLLAWVWRLGAPIGLRGTLEVGSFALFVGILADTGQAELAAHIIVVRIISVSFLPGYGLHEAAAVLVGQALGGRRPDIAIGTFYATLKIGLWVMCGCGVLFAAVPHLLLAPFSPGEEVAAVATQLLLVAAAFQIFDAVAMVAQGSLNGAGDTRFVMVSGVLTAWLVKLPIGYGLAISADLGAMGAWIGLLAEIIVIAVICLHRIRSGKWLVKAAQAVDAPAEAPANLQSLATTGQRPRGQNERVRKPSYA